MTDATTTQQRLLFIVLASVKETPLAHPELDISRVMDLEPTIRLELMTC
jgi:hypothetical protein